MLSTTIYKSPRCFNSSDVWIHQVFFSFKQDFGRASLRFTLQTLSLTDVDAHLNDLTSLQCATKPGFKTNIFAIQVNSSKYDSAQWHRTYLLSFEKTAFLWPLDTIKILDKSHLFCIFTKMVEEKKKDGVNRCYHT